MNKNLKIIARNDTELEDKTIEQLHELLNTEPMNTRLKSRLTKLWNKMEEEMIELYNASMTSNRDYFRDHLWRPRAALEYSNDDQEPYYT